MFAGITGRIYLVEGDTSKVNHMPSAAAQQVPLQQLEIEATGYEPLDTGAHPSCKKPTLSFFVSLR